MSEPVTLPVPMVGIVRHHVGPTAVEHQRALSRLGEYTGSGNQLVGGQPARGTHIPNLIGSKGDGVVEPEIAGARS